MHPGNLAFQFCSSHLYSVSYWAILIQLLDPYAHLWPIDPQHWIDKFRDWTWHGYFCHWEDRARPMIKRLRWNKIAWCVLCRALLRIINRIRKWSCVAKNCPIRKWQFSALREVSQPCHTCPGHESTEAWVMLLDIFEWSLANVTDRPAYELDMSLVGRLIFLRL